jgi:aminoglycoside 6'-N-acetyltransferase I
VQIMRLTKDDQEHIVQAATLLETAFPQAYAECALGEMESCLQCDRIALKAIEKGKLVGFVGAIRQYGNTGWELHPIVIDSAYHNQGIGGKLLHEIEL